MLSFEEKEPNVHQSVDNGRKVVLIGTAHVSRQSAELVERIIREEMPDAVCLELCDSRYENLRNPNRWRETDLFQVIKSGRSYLLMAQLALASFQKRLAKQFGIRPGEEMLRALSTADELGCPIYRVDRDVRVTLKRAWKQAGYLGFARIIGSLIGSMFATHEMSEEEIERLKEGDELTSLMAEFSGAFPGVKKALIDERDLYVAAEVATTPGDRVVAVVGAGHIPGLLRHYGETIDISTLETAPSSGWLGKVMGWLLPILLVALLVYAGFTAGIEQSAKVFAVWALINGAGAALAAVLCRAHPFTILAAFVSAPFAAIHPVIAVGWICALVETFLRKPKVADFETLADDLGTIRGVWNNSVSRIFLILILTNLGSLVGTIIGLKIGANLVP